MYNGSELNKIFKEIAKGYKKSNPYKDDVITDPMGQWKYPGQVTKIPDRNITMKGVDYPVLGVDNLGNEQMMYPGMDYTFPGESVTEYPELDEMRKGGKKKKKKYYSDAERARVAEVRGPVSNPTWVNPNISKFGGWLDKYQTGAAIIPAKKIDSRKLPQSGVVIDKRTNQVYYFGDKGEVGSFPALTGKNPDVNVNPYPIGYLEEHPEARATPKGYYLLRKQNPDKWKTPDEIAFDKAHYGDKIRSLQPIPAFDTPAPVAEALALHRTYNEPGNPSVFKNREAKYYCPPGQRYGTYGCVNIQEPSYDAMNKAIPETDTALILDSKDKQDLKLIQQAWDRVYGKKEEGGEADYQEFFRRGGLKRSPKRTSPKNIQTNLNFLMRRNEMLFGPAQTHMFDLDKKPGSKWLEKYK